MNSLYQQLNNNQLKNNNNFKNLINMFKTSNNPQQLINNLIKNNPQMQSVYELLQSTNKNPKQLFYEIANKKGINPQSILQLLQ